MDNQPPGHADMLLLAERHEELRRHCFGCSGRGQKRRFNRDADCPYCQGRTWTLPPETEWMGLLVRIAGAAQFDHGSYGWAAQLFSDWEEWETDESPEAALAAALAAAENVGQ